MNEEVEVTMEVTTEKEKMDAELVLMEAMHYLGGFTLPLSDSTLTLGTDSEGKTIAVLDSEFALRLKALLKRKEAMEEEVDAFKKYAYKFLNDNNITDVVTSEGVNVLLTKPYVRSGIDTAKLREMLPQVAEFFTKKTNISGSVSIKVDKGETYNPWLK